MPLTISRVREVYNIKFEKKKNFKRFSFVYYGNRFIYKKLHNLVDIGDRSIITDFVYCLRRVRAIGNANRAGLDLSDVVDVLC